MAISHDRIHLMNKKQILMVHGGMTFKNDADYVHWLKTRKVSLQKRPYIT